MKNPIKTPKQKLKAALLAALAAFIGYLLHAYGIELPAEVQKTEATLTSIEPPQSFGWVPDPAAVAEVVAVWRARSPYLPGFGHRFHPVDPRRDPLLALVDQAVADDLIEGRHARAAVAVEEFLNRGRTKPIPMNIDGATAVIYAELGFPAPLARGLFVLSRSVGILAHAWEEVGQGRRNKGPMPPSILPAYRDSRPAI